MISKNAVEKAESMKGRINRKFSISVSQMKEVIDHYDNGFKSGFAFFRLGYMQGMKAAQAEMRKVGKV